MVTSICFFFGTFNPIHIGHLLMAQTALVQFNYEKVLFIPAYNPPHRSQQRDIASFEHRLQMVKRACWGNPRFDVSDIEARREGPSYTYDTLKLLLPHLESLTKPAPLIIGSDALSAIGTWYEAGKLIEKVLFLQAPRCSQHPKSEVVIDGVTICLNTQKLAMPEVDVSSTQLRQWIRQEKSIRYQTPQVVEDYIIWNGLYRE